MMKVEITTIGRGLHPGETVVSVTTRDGNMKLVVDRESLHGTTLSVGYPVGQEGDFYLIELPRETFQGAHRVWVPKSSVMPEEERSKVYA